MKSKSGSFFAKVIAESALLLVAGSALAMSLFHFAGFRGMNHRYPFPSTAELAAGWNGGAVKGGHSSGEMDPGRAEMMPESVQIGEPKNIRDMTATMSYAREAPGSPDIRLEARLVAARTAQNGRGFRAGDFIPDLSVRCSLRNLETGEELDCYLYELRDEYTGSRRYGRTVKMPRAGDYELTLTIEPPAVGPSEKADGGGSVLQKPAVVKWKFTFAPQKA